MLQHIQTPVKGFTGTVVGVNFVDGVGHTEDNAALAYFQRHDYHWLPGCPYGCPAAPQEHSAPADKLTPKQKLQAEAKDLGLSEAGSKEEIETRIAEHKAAAAAPSSTGDPASTTTTGDTAADAEKN